MELSDNKHLCKDILAISMHEDSVMNYNYDKVVIILVSMHWWMIVTLLSNMETKQNSDAFPTIILSAHS